LIRMTGQAPFVRLIRRGHRETGCPAYPDWVLLRFRGGFERFDKGTRSAEWESRDAQRFQFMWRGGAARLHTLSGGPVSPPTWHLAGLGAIYAAYACAGKMPKAETPPRPQTIAEGYSE